MPKPTITITEHPNGIEKVGERAIVAKEDRGRQLPEELHSFVPACIKLSTFSTVNSTQSETCTRVEQHMGVPHPTPLLKVQEWWKARESMWQAQSLETKPLRKWLKSVSPHGKINTGSLRKSLKQAGVTPPSLKWLEHALNTEFTLATHTGPTHNALTPRRIREQGFICWRYSSVNGTRGTDMAPFVEPDGYPLDVQIHILKWAWLHDAPKALRCLQLLHPTNPKHKDVTVTGIQHHPSLKRRWIERMLGCTLGTHPQHQVARGLYRAKKLHLCGHPITLETDVEITPKKDSTFFLPRSRENTTLFSKWNEGIKLDEEGRYSLTPEHHALTIAKHVQAPIVYDAFSGCGGNTIAFARQKHITMVISNELDGARSKLCQHNASLYNVSNKVTFTSHDALNTFPKAPFVFLDPPWALGLDSLDRCWQTFQKHYPHGMIKVPIDFPVPVGTKVRLFSTNNHFPSFLVLIW